MKGETFLLPWSILELNIPALLQRVASASVTVDKQLVSSIGKGVLVFAAVAPHDTEKEVESMANKVLRMKLWPDANGANWKQSVVDIEGEVLCVSQFTLLASTRKGYKPDFHGAAGGDHARSYYQHFFAKVQNSYKPERVKDGVFQAMMDVALVNDGPVTLELETGPPLPQESGKKKASKTEALKNSESPSAASTAI
ncbi:MAG: hypothetical protein LQ340_005617 [Diploschistes diacapsis]|nr:MAG: hypothetical protein LQ340_005617 [Diploschistes diacapsis]